MDRIKILLVDDDKDFLAAVKDRLDSDIYKLVTEENGNLVLEVMDREKPDIVLLDLMIPGIDGLEVLKKIRKTNKNIPVYIITAYSEVKSFKLAKKRGASGFVSKTSDINEEIKNITSLFGVSRRYRKKEKS